jgi:hypothetical protein
MNKIIFQYNKDKLLTELMECKKENDRQLKYFEKLRDRIRKRDENRKLELYNDIELYNKFVDNCKDKIKKIKIKKYKKHKKKHICESESSDDPIIYFR